VCHLSRGKSGGINCSASQARSMSFLAMTPPLALFYFCTALDEPLGSASDSTVTFGGQNHQLQLVAINHRYNAFEVG
jgi:hypothetical protein